ERGERDLEVLAPIRERFLGPRSHQDVERFGAPLPAIVAAEPVADVLVFVVDRSPADADVEAPATQVVEQRELNREADRIITAKPMRIRDVFAARAPAKGIGSQYTASPVKLCSVSQTPSKPSASA